MEDFEIIECIGEGSFGRALLCKDKVSGEKVVVKQVDLSSQPDEIREASLRETKLLSELDHPNIIKSYGSFMEGDILCTVMEYAAGGDLSKKIKEAKENNFHFSEYQILTWFGQICLALQYIHTRHILHRDIKSQNIFLDSEGNAKLGDFGTAKCLEETGDFAETVVGSPFYLSPEICQGVPYNSKTDIWSLGCVLYEMCTLEPAFSGDCIGGIVMKILREEQPPIPGEYSNDLSQLVDWMLQKAPGRRPSISQILGLSFLKQVLPVSMVSTVVIHRMSDEKMREKRPNSMLCQPKEKKKDKKIENKPQDIGLCIMVKNLQKQESVNSQLNVEKKPVAHVRKSFIPPKIKRKPHKPKEEVDLDIIQGCLQSHKLDAKKLPVVANEDISSEETSGENDEFDQLTTFESPPVALPSHEANLEEIEQMRNHLETLLGTETLIAAYNAIKNGEDSKSVINIIGVRNKNAAVLIQRLILREENL